VESFSQTPSKHTLTTKVATNMFEGKAVVDMSSKGLDAGDGHIIAAALEKNDQVHQLHPFGNNIPEVVLRTIMHSNENIVKFGAAVKLDFSNCGMDSTDVKVGGTAQGQLHSPAARCLQ
jgi:hypothetical protein